MLENIYPNFGVTLAELNLLILIKLALNFYCSTKGVFLFLYLMKMLTKSHTLLK